MSEFDTKAGWAIRMNRLLQNPKTPKGDKQGVTLVLSRLEKHGIIPPKSQRMVKRVERELTEAPGKYDTEGSNRAYKRFLMARELGRL